MCGERFILVLNVWPNIHDPALLFLGVFMDPAQPGVPPIFFLFFFYFLLYYFYILYY